MYEINFLERHIKQRQMNCNNVVSNKSDNYLILNRLRLPTPKCLQAYDKQKDR